MNFYYRDGYDKPPLSSPGKIAEMFKCPKQTVVNFINNWKTRGDLQDRRFGKFKMIPPAV